MNHWQMIVIAYGLTFGALALEVALLLRRRRAALRQAQGWLEADESLAPAGTGAGARS
jgi:heme exporter protein CcmD